MFPRNEECLRRSSLNRKSPAVPARAGLYDARPTEPNADVRVHGLGSRRIRSSDPGDTLVRATILRCFCKQSNNEAKRDFVPAHP
jgi:hypothetical protein